MKNNKKVLLYVIIAIFFVGSLIGISYALSLIIVEDTTINKVTIGSLNGSIIEEYDPPEELYPSQEVEKIVSVKNTGQMDIIIRVKIEKAWGESRDENGNLIINGELSTDNIIIDFNNNYWVYDDGYYYYKGILKPDETTLEPLFESFTIDPSTGNEYKEMLADIIVSLEVIQAGNDAIVDIWNKTYEFLEVMRPDEKEDVGDTLVTYISPSERFDINKTKTDLFANFKDLQPGSMRTQLITVKNDYKEVQGIALKANITEQDPEKRELIENLLNEYLWVTITDNKTGSVIYDGPINGNLDLNDGMTMKDYIFLGDFDPHTSKDLIVSLTVSKEMGNEYQNLLGNIEWQFMTSYYYDPPKNPYTGDSLKQYIMILAISVAVLATTTYVFIKTKKEEKKELQK